MIYYDEMLVGVSKMLLIKGLINNFPKKIVKRFAC